MPSEFLSQNEIDAALLVKASEFNAQQQPKVDLAGELRGRARVRRSADEEQGH